jgi:hypothetical protein
VVNKATKYFIKTDGGDEVFAKVVKIIEEFEAEQGLKALKDLGVECQDTNTTKNQMINQPKVVKKKRKYVKRK